MENLVKVFENEEFGKVRTEVINGKPYFCGKDIAECLEYKDSTNAVKLHCKTPGVVKCHLGVVTGTKSNGEPAIQQVALKFISEGNVYRLIAHSKLPNAERFESWVFDEVLPSIRKTGSYAVPVLSDVEKMAQGILAAQKLLSQKEEQIKSLSKTIEDNEPKVKLADSITSSPASIPIGSLSKILKQNGFNTGRNRLFQWLRDRGFLMKDGKDNIPTQKSMELGIFEMQERVVRISGIPTPVMTTRVTGKGQKYFVNLFHKTFGTALA